MTSDPQTTKMHWLEKLIYVVAGCVFGVPILGILAVSAFKWEMFKWHIMFGG